MMMVMMVMMMVMMMGDDDEKADNQYRIKDGQWQRMTPGSKWHTIQNEGSINALNNRYGKSVSSRVVTTTTMKPAKFDDINSDFVAKTEENVFFCDIELCVIHAKIDTVKVIHVLLSRSSIPVVDALQVNEIRLKYVIHIDCPELFITPVLPWLRMEMCYQTFSD